MCVLAFVDALRHELLLGFSSFQEIQLRSYLKEKVAAPGLESQEYGRRDPSR
jgi:hypothetical protein